MSYFEGIGDEVVIFATVLAIILGVILTSLLQNTETSHANQNLQFVQPNFSSQRSSIQSLATESTIQVLETIPESPAESEFQISPDSESNCESQDTEDLPYLQTKPEEPNLNTETGESASIQTNRDDTSTLTDNQSIEETDDPIVLRQRRLDFFTKPVGSSYNQITESTEHVAHQANGSISHAEPVQSASLNDIHTTASGEANVNEFTLRLKFLDDRERSVTTQRDELVIDFKRRLFPDELSERKVIRLIYSGQQLQDSHTIGSYRLSEGSVLHIHISTGSTEAQSSQAQSNDELDLSQFLWPILGVILGVMWILHYQYRDMFNASSTVALLGLSGLFLTFVWAQFAQQQPSQT